MEQFKRPALQDEKGFTLIELSIVLVIIGLIVGGVLVGQDMIKAAQIRATVAQIEKYNAAVNTFRNKYNGLPGDLPSPTNFFTSVTGASSSTTGKGNGNGLIEGSGTTLCGLDGETAVFWYELNQANMIPDPVTTVAMATGALTISTSVLPLAKMGKANFIHVATSSGINYFIIGGFSGATTAASGDFNAINTNVTPNEAFQLDTKMDDGVPNTGVTVSADASSTANIVNAGGTSHATTALAAGDCYDSTLNIYATNAAATRDVNGCILRVRTNF